MLLLDPGSCYFELPVDHKRTAMSPKVLEYLLPSDPDGETLKFIRTVAPEILEVVMRQAKYYL